MSMTYRERAVFMGVPNSADLQDLARAQYREDSLTVRRAMEICRSAGFGSPQYHRATRTANEAAQRCRWIAQRVRVS